MKLLFCYPGCTITSKKLYLLFSELKYRELSAFFVCLVGMGGKML